MKILALGNSFSQDATTFLHQAARAQGIDLTVVNLYIGGCSLERHWRNFETGEPAYQYQLNGGFTGRMVGVQEVLEEDDWDVIITQQCSPDSGWLDSYEPFLTQILAKFRAAAPNATLLLHETWAYEVDSTHAAFPRYSRSQQEMYGRLHACYHAMAEKHGVGLIPSGEIIQHVRTLPPFDVAAGGRSLCRDGFHMSYGYGRYLLGCIWLRTLCGADAAQNPYIPACEEITDDALLPILRQAANQAAVLV